MHSNFNVNMPSWLFPGIRAIYQNLFGIYREKNPMVVSTGEKCERECIYRFNNKFLQIFLVNPYWKFPNSNEPLDYIFIYANPGSQDELVPEVGLHKCVNLKFKQIFMQFISALALCQLRLVGLVWRLEGSSNRSISFIGKDLWQWL